MRNLILLTDISRFVPDVGAVQDFVVDETTQRVFILTQDNLILVFKTDSASVRF